MTETQSQKALRVHASLLYVGPRPLAGPAMADSIAPLLASLGLPVLRRLSDGNTGLSLRTAGPEVLIHAADEPISGRVIRRLKRPAEARGNAQVSRRLAQHKAHVTLRIGDTPGHQGVVLTRPQRIALMQRLLRHLAAFAPPDLVVWHPSDTLFTPDEFRRDGAPRPDPEALVPAEKKAKSLPPIVDDELADAQAIFARLEGRMAKEGVANTLPDLPPRMTDGNEKLRAIFREVGSKAPRREVLARIELAEPEPDDGLAEKLSVYVINGTVMVMSFPAGMGLLTYNILRGGDLKVTARMMALTGTAVGLLTHLPGGLLPGI